MYHLLKIGRQSQRPYTVIGPILQYIHGISAPALPFPACRQRGRRDIISPEKEPILPAAGTIPHVREETGGRKENGATRVSRQKQQSSPQVTFYTKAGCHLCDEAREMLEDIASQLDFDLTEIDIRGNPELFELYRYRIPVIIVDGQILEGRIEFRDLVRAFHLP
ncbi:hypothetical protein A4R35_03840 [Thermogemmatispora tikiterensis]|uniref:Uncharacterized protein n=1 Tax=Thermogemmatispora tikiterensis TaxID=1825093 RepID=A0A328VGC4_9CHLR|nr:hypothetical protein A4R35_03840 [Thermogemmatispora tikiterensis]